MAVLDLVESYREMANGLMEVYLMDSSNRMSEVMKTMAVITVFFMPLSFLAGIYGMNFDVMPELQWAFGYPAVLGLMILSGIAPYWYFKRKGWL